VKCKSLRTVTFPEVLDMYDFCTDKVRIELKGRRGRGERRGGRVGLWVGWFGWFVWVVGLGGWGESSCHSLRSVWMGANFPLFVRLFVCLFVCLFVYIILRSIRPVHVPPPPQLIPPLRQINQ
jgi:hypothetical protein